MNENQWYNLIVCLQSYSLCCVYLYNNNQQQQIRTQETYFTHLQAFLDKQTTKYAYQNCFRPQNIEPDLPFSFRCSHHLNLTHPIDQRYWVSAPLVSFNLITVGNPSFFATSVIKQQHWSRKILHTWLSLYFVLLNSRNKQNVVLLLQLLLLLLLYL